MSRFISFMGKRVEAQYRVADIRQKSVGTLVADTGRSIVVEERILQGERKKTMRVEIPYEYVIRITEAPQSSEVPTIVHSRILKTRR
jgi:hypothetical protein